MARYYLNLARIEHKKKARYKGRIIFYLSIILLITAGYFLIFQNIYASTIYPRVYCNDLNLSGLEREEAKTLLEMLVEKIEAKGFSFSAQTDLGQKSITIESNLIGLADPDLSRQIIEFDIDKTLGKAFNVGRRGNPLKVIFKTLTSLAKDEVIDLEVTINQPELEQILREKFADIEKQVEDARPLLSRGELVLAEGESGFILDYQEGLRQMETNLRLFHNVEIKIPVILVDSQIKIEDSQNAFAQAQDLFSSAPYTLKYKNRKWTLFGSQVAEWFKFAKDTGGQVNLFLNQEKISEYLEEIASQIDIEPIDAKFKISNGRVIEFRNSRAGLALNRVQSAGTITQTILGLLTLSEDTVIDNKTKEINLVVEGLKPARPIEDINDLGIKELVGRGVSNFAGSPWNRRYNIKIGAQKIHGILIAPDEEFSLVKAIGPVNKETGFLPELVIKGDRTIPEYGGGLCQIGTTTFRVALNAGLPITERTPHSYRVVYYEPAGMDATIYTPRPDLRFINDTGAHILFQTEIKGDELIFEFYGTADGRQVETTKPKIYNITAPGPAKFIETDELAPGEKKRVEIAHTGASAEFKNIITFPNGSKREDVWKSFYKAWPEVWMVGQEEKEEKEEEKIKSD